MSFITNYQSWPYIKEMSWVPNDHFPAFETERGSVLFESLETVICLNNGNQVVQRHVKYFFSFFLFF